MKCPHCDKEALPEEGYETIFRCIGCDAVLDIDECIKEKEE